MRTFEAILNRDKLYRVILQERPEGWYVMAFPEIQITRPASPIICRTTLPWRNDAAQRSTEPQRKAGVKFPTRVSWLGIRERATELMPFASVAFSISHRHHARATKREDKGDRRIFCGQGGRIGALLSVYGHGRAGGDSIPGPICGRCLGSTLQRRTAGRSALSLNAPVPFFLSSRGLTRDPS